MSITNTPKLRELALGARLLRSQPQFIDHIELANLVADWIEAEVLMWDTAEQIVELTNSVAADISGGRAGSVKFGRDPDGNPAIEIDTPNPFLSEVQWPPRTECPQCMFVGRHQTWCRHSPDQAWWAAR